MDKQPILADSNVYISLIRCGRNPVDVLEADFGSVNLITCGTVKVEVLRGISIPRIFKGLKEFFDIQQFVGSDNKLWDEAVDIARSLARSGITIPTQDIIIATSAFRAGAAVLTADKHFSLIPNLKVIPSPY